MIRILKLEGKDIIPSAKTLTGLVRKSMVSLKAILAGACRTGAFRVPADPRCGRESPLRRNAPRTASPRKSSPFQQRRTDIADWPVSFSVYHHQVPPTHSSASKRPNPKCNIQCIILALPTTHSGSAILTRFKRCIWVA
jgi:hypothetical protein